MYANMVEDAQAIKRRLSDKGQEIDETVIFELLESCEPHDGTNKAEYIINMITEDRDHSLKDTSETPGSSTMEIKSIAQCNAKNVPNCDVQSFSMGYTYSEIIDLSESDDADFYQGLDFDDIEVVDTETPDIDALLVPSQCKKSLNQITPDSSNSRVVATNNNTQNELESLEENNNNSVYVKSESYDRSRFAESPKPGCSKDSDDTYRELKSFCHSCNSDELQKDAKRIYALLPTYDYNFIYKILCTNQLATNRIELTLWDILPRERPLAQPLRKRRSTENLCTMECKRSYNTSTRRDPMDLSTTSKMNSFTSYLDLIKNEVKDTEWKDVQFINGLSPTSPIDRIKMGETTENKIEVSVVKSERKESPTSLINKTDKTRSNTYRGGVPTSKIKLNKSKALANTEVHVCKGEPFVSSEASAKNSESSLTKSSAIPHKMEASSSEDVLSAFYNLLRPPRFTPNTNNASVVPSIRFLPILAPPKLKNISTNLPTHVLNPTVTRKDNNTTCLTKVLDLSSPENGRSGANVAQSSSTLAVTDSQNKTLSSADHPAATLPMCSKSCQLTEHNAWPCVRPYNNSIMETDETVIENYQQEKDTINKIQYNLKCGATDKGKDCQSSIDIKTNADEGKQENMPNVREEIILNKKARNIYYKLIPMFPCIKTDYIKRLCQCYVKEDLIFDEAALLQNLVEQLLNCDQESPSIKNVATPLPPEENCKSYDVNEQYADLLGIFPEADPVYLRKIAEQIYNDPEQIKQFVQSKLENPDYPTRAQYLAKKKITEQQKQYTTGFQLNQFLEIFPDPFLYFEDEKRQCQFNPHAVDFLKHYFSKIRVNTLLSVYSKFQHNLSLTAKTLETMNQNMKSKRYFNKMVLTENIPLLQECAFIEHKADLRKYLDDLKVKEQKEFHKLKAKGELFECQCCYDDECMPSKCSTCEDGHIFCNSCIVNSTNIILAEGKTHVYCLLNCNCEFPLSVLQRILPPTKFSILLCKRQEAEVMAAGVEGLVSCPFCHFASIPPLEDKVFKCLNPDCMKESCRLCKELNHIPLKCDEVKSDAARLYLEEKMTEALVRKCYRCGRMFFKEEGCNKMTCVCGAQMCYICDKPVTNYDHFQGQGAERSNRCPLWTDDRLMNAKTVISVCNETMKHIKEKNPDVKINVDALLPKLPPKSRGPHEDAAYANVLPERANRITRQIP